MKRGNLKVFTPETIYGVDFSGSRLAGRAIWIATVESVANEQLPTLRLTGLSSLESLCGTAERAPALAALVQRVAQSQKSLWGMDFPFGLPIEIMASGCDWLGQLNVTRTWSGGAYDFGLWCVAQAKLLGGKMHIRRSTDTETKTPFDCYHYRIIYQTFHGMRDVLEPLSVLPKTAILPFQYERLSEADRAVIEACPGSTLKRMSLPHQNYKQPAGGPLTPKRRATRHAILRGLEPLVDIFPQFRRTIMRNGGGDALDAVLAAVGAADSWAAADHGGIARHARYSLEGRVYA